MLHLSKTNVFSIIGLVLGLAACQSSVEVSSREQQSAGALEQNDPATGCVTSNVQFDVCKPPDSFKLEVYESCLQTNTMLTDLQISSWCDDGGIQAGQYTCCVAPPSPPPPPPTEPNPGCALHYMGDGQACQNLADLKMPVYEACNAEGQILTNFFVQDQGACNDGEGVSVGYECCPVPPPPVVCLSGSIGDGETCQDFGDVKWTAHQACEAAGTVLFDLQFTFGESCNPNEGVLVTYQCTAPNENGCP